VEYRVVLTEKELGLLRQCIAVHEDVILRGITSPAKVTPETHPMLEELNALDQHLYSCTLIH
jgi:hypothetical protein